MQEKISFKQQELPLCGPSYKSNYLQEYQVAR